MHASGKYEIAPLSGSSVPQVFRHPFWIATNVHMAPSTLPKANQGVISDGSKSPFGRLWQSKKGVEKLEGPTNPIKEQFHISPTRASQFFMVLL
jgi:hypothetical protein